MGKNKRIKSLQPFLSKNVICSAQEGKLILILLRQTMKITRIIQETLVRDKHEIGSL